MINPLTTQGAPLHHPPLARALSVVAVVALLVLALFVLNKEAVNYFVPPVVETLPQVKREENIKPPTPEDVNKNTILSTDTKEKLSLIQEKVTKGELTREEADKQIQELSTQIPIPAVQ